MNTDQKPNRLIDSTSPYLLQHAYNPVDWFEWGTEALERAKREDKPILVSIGYSSCHWCHVMERECFEKESVAQVMNKFFICIKVDREERPDVDQIYMEAVQAMGINGGWPLNVFLTPDQKPFYGGTYFPPQNWVQLLENIHVSYESRRKEIEESAEELKNHISRSDITRFKQKEQEKDLSEDLETIYKKLAARFDSTWGGLDRAPKFVMPSVWLWLLRYYYLTKNKNALDHILLTLNRIAMGGIYDQVGGGFSRYSVDAEWFAPHFEKMLYDNAQLMSLYSEAYAVTRDEAYSVVVTETFEWLLREMTHSNGGFYSALDADSEGIEGKFYVWTKAELDAILGKDADLICRYYDVREGGNWEHGNNILFRSYGDEQFLKDHNLTQTDWSLRLNIAKKQLRDSRANRIRPGLDDKIITSWNALMTVGLIDAYKALGDERFLEVAIANMNFIERELKKGNQLFRSFKNKHSTTTGFLDDYAYVIQANIKLYQATFNEHWINLAKELTDETLNQFYDGTDGYFHYTSINSEKLIATKKEIFDNVIPSSNSVMAMNLLHLGTIFDLEAWKALSLEMTTSLNTLIKNEPNYMSNWAIIYTELKKTLAEVVITGKNSGQLKKEFGQHFQPFALLMGTEAGSSLPLLSDKGTGEDVIFVCYNKACKLPVKTVEAAIQQIIT
jgi:uncharacterized protein YyaL (SSP411 family)